MDLQPTYAITRRDRAAMAEYSQTRRISSVPAIRPEPTSAVNATLVVSAGVYGAIICTVAFFLLF